MTTTAQVYPGLLDASVEVFNTTKGLKLLYAGRVINFSEAPLGIYLRFKEALNKDKKALAILSEWHPKSEVQRLEKFASCRFGGLDLKPDIISNKLQEAEYHDCAIREHCKGNGIVCKSITYNGKTLSNLHIKLLKFLATNKTNENISQLLNISLGQFHKVKKNLYASLKIQTKQEATIIALRLNIIKLNADV